MPTSSYKVAATNENWDPLVGVEIEAMVLSTLKPESVVKTGLDGVAAFTGLSAGPHFFKVRSRRVSTAVDVRSETEGRVRSYTGQIRLQIIAMGHQGMAKDAVVDAGGFGTHTTIQAAVTAMIALYGPSQAGYDRKTAVIHINPGYYPEQVSVPLVNNLKIILEAQGNPSTVGLADTPGNYGRVVAVEPQAVPSAATIKATGYGHLVLKGLYIAGEAYSAVEANITSQQGLVIDNCYLESSAGDALTITGLANRGVALKDSSFSAPNGSCLGTYTGAEESVNEYALQAHNCVFRGNSVAVIYGAQATFTDCVIVAQSTAGTMLTADNYSVYEARLGVHGCRFFLYGGGTAAIGILVTDGAHLISNGNWFQTSRVSAITGQVGIQLDGAGDFIIEDCRFNRLAKGIYFTGSATNAGIIESCVFSYNTVGIDADAGDVGANVIIGPNVYHDNGTDIDSDVPSSSLYSSHALLDGSYHTDTVAQDVTAGSIVIGNDTPAWDELAISAPAANVRNVLGIDNGETVPSWKVALDGTSPAAVAATASAGTALPFSHRDHVHALGVGTTEGDLLVWNNTPVASRLAIGGAGTVLQSNATTAAWVAQSSIDHGSLGGLTDDDHAGYARLAGRSSGQTLIGGTAASEALTLQSTSHATRGLVRVVDTLSIAPAAAVTPELRFDRDGVGSWDIELNANNSLNIFSNTLGFAAEFFTNDFGVCRIGQNASDPYPAHLAGYAYALHLDYYIDPDANSQTDYYNLELIGKLVGSYDVDAGGSIQNAVYILRHEGTGTLGSGAGSTVEYYGTATGVTTLYRGYYLKEPGLSGGHTITTYVGIDFADISQAGIGTVIGIRCQETDMPLQWAGDARFGATGAPASPVEIIDTNFALDIVSSNPRLTVDSGDYLEYNRAGNYFEANRMLTVPQLQTGEGLGLKVAIWGTFWGLGVQSGVFEFIASRGADGDFRWGYGTSGALTETMYLDSGLGQLQLPVVGAAAGLLLGGDAQLYRSAADVLYTPDAFHAAGGIVVLQAAEAQISIAPGTGVIPALRLQHFDAGGSWDIQQVSNDFLQFVDNDGFTPLALYQNTVYIAAGIVFGIWPNDDVTLYRSAANVLKTDDSLSVAATLTVDTINEYTGAAGITAENVLLKDGTMTVDVVQYTNAIILKNTTGAAGQHSPNLQFVTKNATAWYIRGEDTRLVFIDSGATNLALTISTTAVTVGASGAHALTLMGALNHDGTTVGLFGAVPVAQSAGWAMSNVTATKVLDCDATTIDELADVVGTLIDYLITLGPLAA